jgi:hypothetical protein
MNEGNWLKWLNPLLAFLFAVQALTGFFHSHIPYEVFSKVHGIGGVLLTIGVVLHLWLNRHWIRANFVRRIRSRPPTGI